MPNYYSPGVYVEEVDSGSRPIEGVATAVAAFVGFARKGPFNKPTLVTNWTEFTESFGDFIEGSYLAHSVFGYFANGGNIAYIVRVGDDASKNNAQAALPAAGEGDKKGEGEAFRVVALDPGLGGNELEVEIANATHGSPDDTFKIVVKKNDEPDPVEVFDDLTLKSGVQNAVKVVNALSNTIQLEPLEPDTGNRDDAGPRPRDARRRRRRRRAPDHQGRVRRRHGRADGVRRPRGDRRGDDALRPRRPGRLPGGDDRKSTSRARTCRRADGDDLPLRVPGRPDGDPRRAARAEPAAGSTSGASTDGLRLALRDALLAVDQGPSIPRPATTSSFRPAATWPVSGRAPTRRAASTRRRRTRSSGARSRSRPRSRRPSTTC